VQLGNLGQGPSWPVMPINRKYCFLHSKMEREESLSAVTFHDRERLTLRLGQIKVDQEFQVRIHGYDSDHIQDLKDAIHDPNITIPPVLVARIDDSSLQYKYYTLIDGFHRYKAYQELKICEIDVEVIGVMNQVEALNQTLREANRHYAKKLTRADKTNIVLTYLRLNPASIDLPYNELSRTLRFSPQTIKSIMTSHEIKIKAWKTKRLLEDFSDSTLLEELQRRLSSLSAEHRTFLIDLACTVDGD
jgi:hypothetical protein